MCGRAKEIKHSGPNIGKKVVKRASVGKSSVQPGSVKSSTPPPLPPTRPRGRPPKNSSAEKPTTSSNVFDSARRKSDGPNYCNSSSAPAADKFPLR